MRHKWILISFVLFAVAGVLLAYPLVSTIINSKYHSDIETAYTAAIEDSNADELEQQRQAAQQYNAMLSGAAIAEGGASAPPLPYAEQLTVGGVICYIDIPKINVYLPVQHGTGAETLEKSVGHVVGTSLPVGGSSTHAVLSAHSGMASSKLFSDINQLADRVFCEGGFSNTSNINDGQLICGRMKPTHTEGGTPLLYMNKRL